MAAHVQNVLRPELPVLGLERPVSQGVYYGLLGVSTCSRRSGACISMYVYIYIYIYITVCFLSIYTSFAVHIYIYRYFSTYNIYIYVFIPTYIYISVYSVVASKKHPGSHVFRSQALVDQFQLQLD